MDYYQRRLLATPALPVLWYLVHNFLIGAYNLINDEVLSWWAASASPPSYAKQLLGFLLLAVLRVVYPPVVIFAGTYFLAVFSWWWWPDGWILKCTEGEIEWYNSWLAWFFSGTTAILLRIFLEVVAIIQDLFTLGLQGLRRALSAPAADVKRRKDSVGRFLFGKAAEINHRWTIFIQHPLLVEAWYKCMAASDLIQRVALWIGFAVVIFAYASYMWDVIWVTPKEPDYMWVKVVAKGTDMAHSTDIRKALHLLTNTEHPFRSRHTSSPIDHIVTSTKTETATITSVDTAWETMTVTSWKTAWETATVTSVDTAQPTETITVTVTTTKKIRVKVEGPPETVTSYFDNTRTPTIITATKRKPCSSITETVTETVTEPSIDRNSTETVTGCLQDHNSSMTETATTTETIAYTETVTEQPEATETTTDLSTIFVITTSHAPPLSTAIVTESIIITKQPETTTATETTTSFSTVFVIKTSHAPPLSTAIVTESIIITKQPETSTATETTTDFSTVFVTTPADVARPFVSIITRSITVTPSEPITKSYFKTGYQKEYASMTEEEYEKAHGPMVLRDVAYKQTYEKTSTRCSICKRKHAHEVIYAFKGFVFQNEEPPARWWARTT